MAKNHHLSEILCNTFTPNTFVAGIHRFMERFEEKPKKFIADLSFKEDMLTDPNWPEEWRNSWFLEDVPSSLRNIKLKFLPNLAESRGMEEVYPGPEMVEGFNKFGFFIAEEPVVLNLLNLRGIQKRMDIIQL